MKTFLTFMVLGILSVYTLKAEKWKYHNSYYLDRGNQYYFTTDNNIWFTNWPGIAHYDGKQWEIIKYPSSNSGKIITDPKRNTIWLVNSSYKNLLMYDRITKQWTNEIITIDSFFTYYSDIKFDIEGKVWVLGYDGLYTDSAMHLKKVDLPISDSAYLSLGKIIISPDNTKYLLGAKTMYHLSGTQLTQISIPFASNYYNINRAGKLYFKNSNGTYLSYKNLVWDSIVLPLKLRGPIPIFDSDEKILNYINDTLWMYNGDTVIAFHDQNSAIRKKESKILVDTKGEIWVAKNDTLCTLFPEQGKLHSIYTLGISNQYCTTFGDLGQNQYAISCFNKMTFTDEENYTYNQITQDGMFKYDQILKDSSGKVWFLNFNAMLVSKRNWIDDTLKDNDIPVNPLRILVAQDGTLWLLFKNKLATYKNNTLTYFSAPFYFLPNYNDEWRYKLFEDSQHRIWVFVIGLGFYIFDGETWQNMNFSSTNDMNLKNTEFAALDHKDQLWTNQYNKNGLVMYNEEGWHFYPYLNESAFFSNDITSMAVDQNNTVWLTSFTKGILRFDGKDYTHYTKENSPMMTDLVLSVEVASNNDKWFFMDFGVLVHNEKETKVENVLADNTPTIFPNPVQNNFKIDELAQYDIVRMLDMTGRIVMTNLVDHNGISQFNIEHCHNGMFLVQVIRNRQTLKTIKLIKND